MKNDLYHCRKFFSEICYYQQGSEEERQASINYLQLWKNNLLKKIRKDSFQAELMDEQIIERESKYFSALRTEACIALKVCIELKFEGELGWH